MKQVNLIQLGVGLIGQTTIAQVRENRSRWQSDLGLDIVYRGMIDTSTAVCCQGDHGYAESSLATMLLTRQAGGSIADAARILNYTPRQAIDAIALVVAKGPTILLDTATGHQTAVLDATALELGAGVVLSNKAPLALDWQEPLSQSLWAATGLRGRLRYETTCGAGLPVISTLRALLDTGDHVINVSGALSGTLGTIFSALAGGASFSGAVSAAREQGFSEPDPRDDFSGLDVARKALILARTMGRTVNLAGISIESLVPGNLAGGSVDAFMTGIHQVDSDFVNRAAAAAASGSSLKYVASVNSDGPIEVGVRKISADTVLGSLQGPENVVSIRSTRYDAYPVTIAGPGAGAAVTAAGVVADMLQLAIMISEG